MNKNICVLFVAVQCIAAVIAAAPVSALEIEVFGELKTGLFYEQTEKGGETYEQVRLHNNDGDSGIDEGRLRFGIGIKQDNFGMRTRFIQSSFKPPVIQQDTGTVKMGDVIWVEFAYAYGSVLNDQLKISAGLLGESPWTSGGPEINRELEMNGNNPLMGIRTEFKPTFLSFLTGLNIGFVINMDNDPTDVGSPEKFADLIRDSVVGITWDNEYFLANFAYRFSRPTFSAAAQQGGEQFIYRAEERLLGRLVPGLQLSVNGYRQGIGGTEGRAVVISFVNWFYARYDNDFLTAGFDARYEDTLVNDQQFLELRPMFFYKFLNNLISVGARGGIEFGFNRGRELPNDSIYNFWYVEPQVRLNINSNLYVAAVYRYTAGLYRTLRSYDPDQVTHWVNLRLAYSF